METRLKSDAMEVWFEAMTTNDPSQAILNQEARGQQALVNSAALPKECSYCTREQLETMGIVFGKDIDDLFIEAQLPMGWKKVATSHSMHSHLVDEKGRNRAAIFYKAAFYDRRADISLTRRFNLKNQSANNKEWGSYDRETEPCVCIVIDCDEEIWRSDELVPTKEVPWFELDKPLRQMGLDWLNEHYPEWKDPLAYWD